MTTTGLIVIVGTPRHVAQRGHKRNVVFAAEEGHYLRQCWTTSAGLPRVDWRPWSMRPIAEADHVPGAAA